MLLDTSLEWPDLVLEHLPLLPVLTLLSLLPRACTPDPMSSLLLTACFISSLVGPWGRKAVSPLDRRESSEAVL